MPTLAPASLDGGRRRSGASVKTLKKMLKKAGLKTTGRKAALTRRAKKAHLVKGGVWPFSGPKKFKCHPKQEYAGQMPARTYCAETCAPGDNHFGDRC